MTEETIAKERDIRGSTLFASVYIESLILRMIYFSNEEQYEIDKDSLKYKNSVKLKNFTFGQKINKLSEVLEKYHPDLFKINKYFFEILNQFKELRNKIAHNLFEWEDNIDEFNMWEMVEDENSFQYLVPVKYKTKEISIEITVLVSNCEEPMNLLMDELELRLKTNHRPLYDLISLGDIYSKSL